MNTTRNRIVAAVALAALFTAVTGGSVVGPGDAGGDGPAGLAFDEAADGPIEAGDTEGRNLPPATSDAAKLACGMVEMALDAETRGDWTGVEEAVYAAYPYATSASEPEVARLGAGLLDALAAPDLVDQLDAFLDACGSAGLTR